jgi:hypothetical protein
MVTAAPASALSALSHSPLSSSDLKKSPALPSVLTSLGTAKNSQQYAKALRQVASKPGLSLDASLNSLAAKIAAGQVSPSSVYLPNLNLLASGPHTPSQAVGVGYTANPAPMGIGDFGLGVTPYAYNTTHFQGSLTLNAANGTYPGAYYFITPPGATGGSYNSPYYVGIQLNTVTSNIQTPGNNQTSFWTQNVVTINGNWIQFENNVWNFSAGDLLPGSILSGNGTYVAPTFYYDYGPSFPLTFPVTINLYNNVSVVNHMDQVTFGYRVVDSKGVFQGIYDTVVFNNSWAPMDPQFAPNFQVSGTYTTPLGLDYDSELIFGGPGGGSNAVFNSINGTESLQYSNLSSGGWKSVPSAYDFGGDTGETAIGVAETWNPADGGSVNLSTGPSLLYGLWNSPPDVQSASGSIHYQGTVSPDWAFVFMGDGGPYFNQSYVPTNATGAFNTYVPPVNGVFPNSAGHVYYAWGVADGYARDQVDFSATTTGVTLTLSPSVGQMTEPLYLNGNSQAESAAAALRGWTTGPLVFSNLDLLSGTSGHDALFFDHLNDWGFVSFNLFQATDVTDVINVTSIAQGNSFATANNYYLDGPPIGSPSTLLGIPPPLTNDLPQYGELIAFYSDPHVQVYDQGVQGYFGGSPLDPSGYYNLNPAGGAMVLWNTPDAVLNETASEIGSYGAWIAGSPGVTDTNAVAILGANAVSLAGSNDATVQWVTSVGSVYWHNDEGWVNQTPFGVYDTGSIGGTFSDITAIDGGVGFADFGGTGAVVNDVVGEGFSVNVSSENIDSLSIGTLLNGAMDTSINNTTAYDGAIGVADGWFGFSSFATTVTNLSAFGPGDALGLALLGSDYTNVTNFVAQDTSEGAYISGTQNTTFTNTLIEDVEYGVRGGDTNYTTSDNLTVVDTAYGFFLESVDNTVFTNTNITFVDDGIVLLGAVQTTVTNLNASLVEEDAGVALEDAVTTTLTNILGYGSVAVWVDGANLVTATNITGTNAIHDAAVFLEDGSGATVTLVASSDECAGVEFEDWTTATVTQVNALADSVGVYIEESSTISVSGVTVSGGSVGVAAYYSNDISVTTVSTTDPFSLISVGVYTTDTTNVSVSQITATDESIGVEITDGSQWTTVTSATVTNMSVAVYSVASDYTYISGVTATNASLSSPWSDGHPNGVPGVAAVVTEDDYLDTISNVTATTYPAAYFDYYSGGPGVDSVNASSSTFAIVLNGTSGGTFVNIGAYQDWVGMELNDGASYNTITMSTFVDSTSYGVAVYDGSQNVVYDSSFIGNNGATGTYSAAHIQALAGGGGSGGNYFDLGGIGNYWADWHTYNQYGQLAPYPLVGGSWDYYPLGPMESFTVNFSESGLPIGTTWSVTLGGVTQSSKALTISFTEPMGTYSYGVGALAGWASSPSSGSVLVTGPTYNVSVRFSTVVYAVTLSVGGLSADTTWSATVNGVTQSTSGTSLVFYLANGTFPYAFNAVSGYSLSSSGNGTLAVNGAPLAVATTYSSASTPSYVSTDTFNTWLAVAFAIAVIALVLALLALFLRRRREEPPSTAAQAWTPPPTQSTGGAPPASGSSGSGSEGPPAGGSPPS